MKLTGIYDKNKDIKTDTSVEFSLKAWRKTADEDGKLTKTAPNDKIVESGGVGRRGQLVVSPRG